VNTSFVKSDILESLEDREFRQAFVLESVYTNLCFQLRALREQRGWSQEGLGKVVKMAQERISILEDPNAGTKPTLNTLLRLADGLDVGLDVRFVPFSLVLDRSVHTKMKNLEVPSFLDELPEIHRRLAAEQILASPNQTMPYKDFMNATVPAPPPWTREHNTYKITVAARSLQTSQAFAAPIGASLPNQHLAGVGEVHIEDADVRQTKFRRPRRRGSMKGSHSIIRKLIA
jgi:transcriptional regulator with XRE-family HTH domain